MKDEGSLFVLLRVSSFFVFLRVCSWFVLLRVSSWFVLVACSVSAQCPVSDTNRLAEVRQLFAEQRWLAIVRIAEAEAEPSPDLDYYYGTALARLERWADAARVFQRSSRRHPGDKRFPLALAGVSFEKKSYGEAANYLRRALRLDSTDFYANDFLGSVYFLQSNLEAALKYWNRVAKPQIEEVRFDPTPKVDPVLLDHAFAFAPATQLRLSDLRTTDARVSGLNIFPTYRFDLEARSDGKFDVVVRARERNGWGSTKWQGFLSLFRGVPFQTVHPEFFNIDRRAINSESLVRWDAQKRRLWTNLSGPFSGDPKRRFGFDLDLRYENWDLRDSFTGSGELLGRLNLRKQAFAADVTSFVNGRLHWSTGVELSHRDFREVNPGSSLTPGLLARGFQLKHLAHLSYGLARMPEKRLKVTTSGSTQLGRIWSGPSHAFAKLQGSLEAHWVPQGAGDDYEMRGKLRAGKTLGQVPFDELFILGVERDADLWLRAHAGTRHGRKGSAPLGRNYMLANWELVKNVYGNGLISLKLGPFLDSGKITDSSPGLGSKKWLWDAGAQAKVKVLGVGVAVSFGKDLRSGNSAFYVAFLK